MQQKLFSFLVCLLCCTALQAATKDELMRLEVDMLKYFSTSERDTFTMIAEQLKYASKEAGQDKLFYKAWSQQAIYEATRQNYAEADQIATILADYAKQQGSNIGEYYALYSKGYILLQQNDYDAAEPLFLNAISILRKHFPKENAVEDLRELMKIAYLRNDNEQAKQYAKQLLAEPHLAPHHKGRTLNRLSIMAFDENNVEEFNHIYNEMRKLTQKSGIRLIDVSTEVNHLIINGNFQQALRLSDLLAADSCAEKKAFIYHRMGDNDKAYEYMVLYKHLSDSITRSSHSNTVANLYLRMNNDRLRLEREVLQNKNSQLRNRFYIIGGVLLFIVLLLLIFRWRRAIGLLKNDKLQLEYEKKDAERALEDLHELSFYESKDKLPLNSLVRPAGLCDYLTTATQAHCHKGVSMVLLTDMPDDLEIKTNANALNMLLKHLLDTSARFTYKGIIEMSCTEVGDNVFFQVTDTSPGLAGTLPKHKTGIFSEQDHKKRHIGMNFIICQSITRLLQGRIWYDKTYTNGARFCVELPKVPNITS